MSDLSFSNGLLKIYTNKNSSIFSEAGKSVSNNINGRYGIVYDDFDCNAEVINSWKPYNLQIIFTIAPRRKTKGMDDKILFHKRMSDSIFTPESYLSVDDISDNSGLFCVKNPRGKCVNIYDYNKLHDVNTVDCVIQRNILNPDLYNNNRYKIRQLVLLYNKNVYLHKNSFFTNSNIQYNDIVDLSSNLHDMGVINQKHDTIFDFTNKLENFETINENIKLAVIDFKNYYSKEIDEIQGNEYAILGFDIIVDNDKNIQIIEINHRSNYSHPQYVRTECDVGFFKDMMLLFMNNNVSNHWKFSNNRRTMKRKKKYDNNKWDII